MGFNKINIRKERKKCKVFDDGRTGPLSQREASFRPSLIRSTYGVLVPTRITVIIHTIRNDLEDEHATTSPHLFVSFLFPPFFFVLFSHLLDLKTRENHQHPRTLRASLFIDGTNYS